MQGQNPIIYADFPDPDVILVDQTYYMISTAMHMFPGGQILRSYDLMHWEHCAYVYEALGETPRQRMQGGHIYGKGMWAGCIRHHGGLFHVVFTSNDTGHSYHFTAEKAEGPWVRQPMEGFWYDPSVLFDDDGRAYIAHGNRTVRITELTADLRSKKEGGLDRIAVQDSDSVMLGWEGSHLLHLGGWYYLFCIHWRKGGRRAMGCFRARHLTDGFEGGEFMELPLAPREDGVAQGGPIQTADGGWALLLFQDHGAVGRIPVLVPFTWRDGWPVVDAVPIHLDLPSFRPEHVYQPLYAEDLTSPLWQWNHEPELSLIARTADSLRITTNRVATDCTQAINTLTQRCFFPRCTAEVTVDGSDLRVGDHAGLCALQGCFAQAALVRTEGGFCLSLMTREDEKAPYAIAPASETPRERVRIPWGESAVTLRAEFDFDADGVRFFFRSGGEWLPLGEKHRLVYRLDHFMGCRIGLFCHAAQEAGGTAAFSRFRYTVNDGREG